METVVIKHVETSHNRTNKYKVNMYRCCFLEDLSNHSFAAHNSRCKSAIIDFFTRNEIPDRSPL